MKSSTEIQAAINAGYADSYSQITEQNIIDLRDNTVGEGCYKYFRIVNEDGSDRDHKECMFNNAADASDGEDNSTDEPVEESPNTETAAVDNKG